MQSMQLFERRTSARSRVFTLVRARGVDQPLWAWDIGLGGMNCHARSARWPGTYLDLSFTLPGIDEPFEVGSQVISFDPCAHGVSLGLRFCLLSVKHQRLIYRFLDQRRTLWSSEPLGLPMSTPADPAGFVCPIAPPELPRLSELTV